MTRALTDQEAATLRETIVHKGKIEGMRLYRALTGATVAEALAMVSEAMKPIAGVERAAPRSAPKPRRGSAKLGGKILNVDLPAAAVAALECITQRTGRSYTQTVALALLDMAALTEGTQEAEPYREPLEPWANTGDAP